MRRRDGKTYFVMTDAEAFRDGVGRLLAEVQRIKGEGDYAAAQALFEAYGVHFDPALRDEVVARVDALQLPSYTGVRHAALTPVRDAAGAIVDVEISYPCDLETPDARLLRMRLIVIAARSSPAAARRRNRCGSGCWRLKMRACPPTRRSRRCWRGCGARDEAIASRAVRGLGRFERPAFARHLLPLLADARPAVRREAAWAIGQSLAAVPTAAADAGAARAGHGHAGAAAAAAD